MILNRAALILLLIAPLHANPIKWSCDAQSVNVTSSGQPMDSSFRFELGVFPGGFVPSAGNASEWASHWESAQRVTYNTDTKRFSGQYQVQSNNAPFTDGAQAYIWGFGGNGGSEWILFRGANWFWPEADPLDTTGVTWNASNATLAVVGHINTSGNPFLMQTAVLLEVPPPPTTYADWQSEELGGVAADDPGDDPDGDGNENILEFVFDTQPLVPDALPGLQVSIVSESGKDYMQVRIPRRVDHIATLTMEVSADLSAWNSGASFTSILENSPPHLLVRVLAPVNAANPRKFLRVKALP